jgi:transglutaminase-like putative cysteine protease
MARGTDPAPGRQRLLGLAAVAGLAAATAFAFGRVFEGRATTWELVAAAVASVGVAALFERRGLALATVASLVGLALAITWIVLPQTAWYGLPSIRTIRALGRSLEFVGQQARVRVAPTAPLPPLVLAALTAVWTASFSAHALAVRAGSPLLAILPMVALVGFADTVLQDGARPVYAVTFLVAALAVVFTDGLRRVRQWGPVWSSGRSGRIRASVKGSRAVAGLVIVAAILIPGLLPGFRADALVDFSTSGDEGIDLDPFVSIHAQLGEQTAIDLFEVRAERAAYWRLLALDEFDGSSWTSSDPDATERGQVLSTPAVLPLLPDQVPDGAPRLPQRFTILRDIDKPYLPMAHPAEAVTLPFGEITYDPLLSQALLDGGLDEGLEYTVSSRVVTPTPEQLDDVYFLTREQYGRYTFVSGSVDPRVGELAERWTRNEDTPYRKIYALQQHFLDGSFVYNTEVDPESDADAMFEFLTETRQGFCQQFATSMAIMVRELGFPARVAVGYRSGTQEDGVFTVQTKDAHAWVEVFFPGYGWLPFEPTPSRPNPLAESGSYLNPPPPGAEGPDGSVRNENGLEGGGAAGCTEVGPDGRPLPGQLCNSDLIRPQRGGGIDGLPPGFLDGADEPEPEPGYSVPYRWIFLGLLAVLGVLLVLVPIVKSGWRRAMLRRSRPPRDLVLAAYRVFDGEAADLGLGRRDGETLEEHRARLSTTIAFSDGHLGRLTSAAGHAAYGPSNPTVEEARAATGDARRAIRDLRRDAGWVRRIVGTYRPGI